MEPKRHPKEPPIRSAETFTPVGEKFTVGNITYGWRQLGFRDATEWLKIVESALTWGLHDAVVKLTEALAQGVVGSSLAYVLVPLMGVQVVEEQIFSWFESMILHNGKSLAPGTLSDPEAFPLEDVFTVIESMDKHPGLVSFFGSLSRMQNISAIKMVIKWVETAMERYAALTAEATEKAKTLQSASLETSTTGSAS